MLQFFKAQGHVLYFPQLDNLENTVVLDPEWLAKIFASVVSYRDTGISTEGFIGRSLLGLLYNTYSLEVLIYQQYLLHNSTVFTGDKYCLYLFRSGSVEGDLDTSRF